MIAFCNDRSLMQWTGERPRRPGSGSKEAGRVHKPLKRVAHRPAARAGDGAEMALDGSHLRSLRADLCSDSLKMAPADRPGVGTRRGPKALRPQRQSENAHGQRWIGRGSVLEGNLSEKPEQETGAINQA